MILKPPNAKAARSASASSATRTCPRCRVVPIVAGEHDVSRFDNMTHVCAVCALDEAEFEMVYGHVPDFRYTLYNCVAQERGA